MKKIEDGAAFVFITCVAVLGAISILGVWNFFAQDVITKSFETIGLLALVAVVVIVAGRFIDARKPAQMAGAADAMGNSVMPMVEESSPIFTSLRRGTLAVLIVSVVLLALLGVLAIWEVVSGDVMNKSLSSIVIIAFDAFIIVVTCMEREGNNFLSQKGKPVSGGMVLLIILLFLWFLGPILMHL